MAAVAFSLAAERYMDSIDLTQGLKRTFPVYKPPRAVNRPKLRPIPLHEFSLFPHCQTHHLHRQSPP